MMVMPYTKSSSSFVDGAYTTNPISRLLLQDCRIDDYVIDSSALFNVKDYIICISLLQLLLHRCLG